MLYKKLLLFGCLLFSQLSVAKIHLEPYVGFGLTMTKSSPLTNNNFDENKNPLKILNNSTVNALSKGRYYGGVLTGMRLGYSKFGLAIGGDFTIGRLSSLYKENFFSYKDQESLTPILLGVFVSYKLPLLFRAYATFIPLANVQIVDETGASSFCRESKGAKIGISYLSLPFISINLEYLPLFISGDRCKTWSHTGTAYVNFIF